MFLIASALTGTSFATSETEEKTHIAVKAAGGPEAFLARVAAEVKKELPIAGPDGVVIREVAHAGLQISYRVYLTNVPDKKSFRGQGTSPNPGVVFHCTQISNRVLFRDYKTTLFQEFVAANGETLFTQVVNHAVCAALR